MATYPEATESCGCVFCDLELATVEDQDTHTHVHQVRSRATDGLMHTKFIPCPVKNK